MQRPSTIDFSFTSSSMGENTLLEDFVYWNGMLFSNNAVDFDETMSDLDSSVIELPVWRDPFVEDCGSLVSELLNCDQRFSDFSSNATPISHGPEVLAVEDSGSLDSCFMELEFSSIQEDLMEESRTEQVPKKSQGISDCEKDVMRIEAKDVSSEGNNSGNDVGCVETEPRDLVPTSRSLDQSSRAPNAGVLEPRDFAPTTRNLGRSSQSHNAWVTEPRDLAPTTRNLGRPGQSHNAWVTEPHDALPTSESSCRLSHAPNPSENQASGSLISDCSDYRGILIIHLLTACCEAISVGSHDLVEILLCRLQEMVSPTGSTIERVAFYLSQALQQLHGGGDQMEVKMPKMRDMGALILFNQVYPFIRIPHFTANQSILEAIKGSRTKLHIIDFDIMEGMQWPPLMEALKSEGHKIEHLKITALKWDCDDEDDDDDEVPLCIHTGRRLAEYAESLGIPFSFEETTLENMKTNKDEIVALNCMWALPHMCERSRESLMAFINGGHQLNSDILTIGTGPPDEPHPNLNLLQSFGECLRNLCAVFDCSEAGLPEQFWLARTKIENSFLASMICRSLNHFSSENGELGPLVMDIPLKGGFTEGEISKKNAIFAKQMLPTNYEVQFEGSHQILLQWRSTVLSRVSLWKPVNFVIII